MPDNQPPANENENPNESAGEGQDLSAEAAKILEEVKRQVSAEPPAAPPSSQPKQDPNAAYIQAREDFKKKMNFSEEQMQLYERDKVTAQAPVLLELAKMKVKEGHKDYDQLKVAFEKELQENYLSKGVVVNPELAEKIFLMVKGQEFDAGRYQMPSSQPTPKSPPSPGGRGTTRIAPGYSGAEPGLGGGTPPGGDSEEGQLSDREKVYASVLNVDAKDYRKMKEEKEQGIREIGKSSIRAPEIDVRTAGPADRDLAALWSKNGGRI